MSGPDAFDHEAFDYEAATWGAETVRPGERTIAGFRLDEALLHLPERGRVLEVGCGAGRFLCALRVARPELALAGTDVSQASANAAGALFGLITELEGVAEAVYRDMELAAPDEESLLVGLASQAYRRVLCPR